MKNSEIAILFRRHAWGQDLLKPISRSSETNLGLGLTLVDSLDTLIIMDLKEEFVDAREWIKSHLDVNIDHQVCFNFKFKNMCL